MRAVLRQPLTFLTLIIFLSSAAATAQAYGFLRLVPATDSGYEISCLFIDDDDTDLCRVAVVVDGGDHVGLDAFQVTPPALHGLTWTHLFDQSSFLVLGNSQDGAAISFGACVGSPVQVMTIWYNCPGLSPCGDLYTIGDPYLIACDNTRTPAGYGRLSVNGVFGMPPGSYDPDCFCATVPVDNKTWGAIKALYSTD